MASEMTIIGAVMEGCQFTRAIYDLGYHVLEWRREIFASRIDVWADVVPFSSVDASIPVRICGDSYEAILDVLRPRTNADLPQPEIVHAPKK